ncbi:MAG: choline dehydrogenase [Pseudomonadota bacterium]|jgi:choline dehydrogenase
MTGRASKDRFDYVIIGSGSAGSVVAARLAEDPTVSVLLLEAGPADQHLFIQMPAAVGFPLTNDRFNWFYNSEPEPGLGGRPMYAPRGRVLGGTSSINGMNWVRGNPWDYDNWDAVGAKGWSYADVLPYFKKSETYDQGPSAYRGGSGPMKIETSGAENPLFQAFLQAGEESGLPRAFDHNGYQQEGVHVTQRNIHAGARWSAAQGYIHAQPPKPNLTILTGVRVTGIEISNRRAVRVRTASKAGDRCFEVERETLLCAGAINTPHLLLLSGIGHADDLKQAGISLTHHLPGVGRGLKDHIGVSVRYGVSTKKVSAARELSLFGKGKLGLEWLLFKKGFGATNYFETGAFLRTRDDEPAPNIQFEFNALLGNIAPGSLKAEHGFLYYTSIMRPKSEGRVWLESPDPFAAPKFRYNYFADPDDLDQLVEGVRAARRVIAQRAWDRYRGEELDPSASLQTDDDLRRWVRATGSTGHHPCRTCRMGTDEGAVVDPEGRVRGIDGLRVIDASIMPEIVTGNTNAAIIMLAEKLADAIRGQSLAPARQPYPAGRQPAQASR